ncbi:Choline dehydrogenase [Pseudoxanthomonas sp. GM95]|uniref:GMC oxidoreductase n=1 Tax=Pseudoxanthomonas sp. GM95 TaxID=1881043 RepID=UPI0008D2BB10|nr:GMC family oxidoreductase [Pseudoxanthomonas sp. GM95]SEM40210.1 Choline dehydrogenase [Pseudoxanthomonas sp. GM95]
MFVDAKALPPDSVIRADICIVGAGPAGIALATELRHCGLRVILLESGGLNEDLADRGQPASTSVFEGHRGLWTTRRFGGNANRWLVDAGLGANHLRLVPLSAADFEARVWMPNSGWPLTLDELNPFYARAQTWFELPQWDYGPAYWEGQDAPRLPLQGSGLRTSMFQFADKDVVLTKNRELIGASGDVNCYYNATATRLQMDEAGVRVTAVHVAPQPGHAAVFEADTIVLAQGGLATPQLLLASNDCHANGIGNTHDLVGRYFMDHPLIFGGTLTPASRKQIDCMALYDLRRLDGTSGMGHLQLTDATLRGEPCVNLSTILFPRRSMSRRREIGFRASQRVRDALQKRGRLRKRDLLATLYGLDGVAQQYNDRKRNPISHLGVGGWSKTGNPSHRLDHFEVLHQAEQPPRYDNRVRLGEERDDLGNRRIEIQWRWHDQDIALVHKTQDIFARELARSGVGTFEIRRPFEVKTTSTTHFLGTTRMHDDPRSGVVDRDGRVHGVDNLFVTGSAVFPSGGYANPTLTIVALSLRLADRIRRQSQRDARDVISRAHPVR